MKHTLVFDIEANGLLEDATAIHCICGKFIDKKEDNLFELSLDLLTPYIIGNKMSGSATLIGHNILRYDLPMIKKFYSVDLESIIGVDNILDTYILSKLLYPDRQLPKGCPTSIFNPVTKKRKKIGPHSLEAWAYRVGYKKIEISDWRYYNEEMLKRCTTDVTINELVYYELLREAGMEI